MHYRPGKISNEPLISFTKRNTKNQEGICKLYYLVNVFVNRKPYS